MPFRLWLVPTLAFGLLPAAEPITSMASPGQQTHYLTGLLQIDGVRQRHFRDTGAETPGNQMWIRAELGAKAELDDRVEVRLTLAYDAEAGDHSEDPSDTGVNRGTVVIDDAWVILKDFLHPNASVDLGRMPVSFNLRKGRGAFLFDSRANDPDVTSWDGAKAAIDLETWTLTPFYYFRDETNEGTGLVDEGGSNNDDNVLYGIVVDWAPESATGHEPFFTGSWILEPRPRDLQGANIGHKLETLSLGTDWKLVQGWEFWAEWAWQSGEAEPGVRFDGEGWTVGAQWNIATSAGPDSMSISLQLDQLSGDTSNAGKDSAFRNRYENVSDTLIVEDEHYGELSQLTETNGLRAIKLQYEWLIAPGSRVRLRAAFANYALDQEFAGDKDFGDEFDLRLSWDYNYFTTIEFLGGVFFPGSAYENIRGNDSDVTLFAGSLRVEF